jgi:two-component system, NtrC family, sensor kinase
MKTEKRQRPRKSLRTILILWLLIFSVVPLAFITGYSLVKYEQAIDQELSTRLLGNALTIGATFGDYQSTLMSESRQIAGDKALTFYLASNNISQAREGVKRWF